MYVAALLMLHLVCFASSGASRFSSLSLSLLASSICSLPELLIFLLIWSYYGVQSSKLLKLVGFREFFQVLCCSEPQSELGCPEEVDVFSSFVTSPCSQLTSLPLTSSFAASQSPTDKFH